MIFSLIHSSALGGVEKIINSALAYDPATQRELAELAGKVLVINSTMPPLQIAIEPTESGLMLHPFWNDEANTTLNGSMVAILRLAIEQEDRLSFVGTGVDVTGDIDLLRQCNRLLRNLDVDWEAILAKMIGDVPAHMMGEAVRNSFSFQKNTATRVKSAIGELAQEELQLNPTATEFEEFRQQVRHVSADTDRLSARLGKYQQTFERKHTEGESTS